MVQAISAVDFVLSKETVNFLLVSGDLADVELIITACSRVGHLPLLRKHRYLVKL